MVFGGNECQGQPTEMLTVGNDSSWTVLGGKHDKLSFAVTINNEVIKAGII